MKDCYSEIMEKKTRSHFHKEVNEFPEKSKGLNKLFTPEEIKEFGINLRTERLNHFTGFSVVRF